MTHINRSLSLSKRYSFRISPDRFETGPYSRREDNTMTNSTLVGLIFEAWKDLDRVTETLEPDESAERYTGTSSIAWSLAHVATVLDAWINVRFQGLPAHPFLGEARFQFGGTGEPDDLPAIRRAVAEVREIARGYLDPLSDDDLNRTVDYRGRDATLRYALMRMAAHHYFHIGDIASIRSRNGRSVGDYPGALEECR